MINVENTSQNAIIGNISDYIGGYVDTTTTTDMGHLQDLWEHIKNTTPSMVPPAPFPVQNPWIQQTPGVGQSHGYSYPMQPAQPSPLSKPAISHVDEPTPAYAEAINLATKLGFRVQQAQRKHVVGSPRITEYFWITDDEDFTVYMTYVDNRHHGDGDESLNFSLIGGRVTNPTSSLIQLDGVPPERVSTGLSQIISGLILARRALDIGTGFSA